MKSTNFKESICEVSFPVGATAHKIFSGMFMVKSLLEVNLLHQSR